MARNAGVIIREVLFLSWQRGDDYDYDGGGAPHLRLVLARGRISKTAAAAAAVPAFRICTE